MSAAADGVTPIRLSRGLHRSASDGACLMELASLLAGDPWSDHPASVHPVLGAVARAVNDRVSDTTRGRLAPLAPLMVGTAGADVESCARLVVLCTTAALNQTSFMSSDLDSARRRALSILARAQKASPSRGPTSRLALGRFCRERTLLRVYPRRASVQVTLAVAIMEDTFTDSDRRLTRLLEACVAECRSQPVGAPAPFLPATLDR